MGLISSLLFGKGGPPPDKKSKIIQEAASQASERQGLAKLVRGPYKDAGYRRAYDQQTQQDIKRMRKDVGLERVERERDRARDDRRWDLHIDRELGLSALRDRIRREEAAGRTHIIEKLKRDLTSREDISQRRRLDRQNAYERAEKRYELGIRQQQRDYYKQSARQWHEGVKTAREQVERQRLLQQYAQQQSNAQRRQPGQELGQGGFRRTNPGPAGSGQRGKTSRTDSYQAAA